MGHTTYSLRHEDRAAAALAPGLPGEAAAAGGDAGADDVAEGTTRGHRSSDTHRRRGKLRWSDVAYRARWGVERGASCASDLLWRSCRALLSIAGRTWNVARHNGMQPRAPFASAESSVEVMSSFCQCRIWSRTGLERQARGV